jgi:hypothetical protein
MANSLHSLSIELFLEHKDAAEQVSLAEDLRKQLLAVAVEDATLASGKAPPDAKAVDAVSISTIVVALTNSPELIQLALSVIQNWLNRLGSSRVKVKLGDDELELSGRSPTREQMELIKQFMERR